MQERKAIYPVDNSFQEEMKAFIRHIEYDSPVDIGNINDALKAIKIIEKVYAEGK